MDGSFGMDACFVFCGVPPATAIQDRDCGNFPTSKRRDPSEVNAMSESDLAMRGGLVVTRQPGQGVRIIDDLSKEDISIVVGRDGGKIKLWISAGQRFRILRDEIIERIF